MKILEFFINILKIIPLGYLKYSIPSVTYLPLSYSLLFSPPQFHEAMGSSGFLGLEWEDNGAAAAGKQVE